MEEELHQFPDGSVHSFPKGTSLDVIKKAMGLQSQETTSKSTIPRTKSTDLDLNPDRLKHYLDYTTKFREAKFIDLNEPTINSDETGLVHKGQKPFELPKYPNYKQPILFPTTAVSSAAGVAAGILTKSPVLGSAAAASVDKFLRYATGEEKYEDPLTTGLDIAGNTILNEVGGRLLALPFKGAAALRNSGVPDSASILNLKPTYAQLLRSNGSKYGGLAGGFENLFAPTSKTKALEASFEAAKDAGDKFIQTHVGSSKVNLEAPNILANKIAEGEKSQFLKLKIESNARGEAAKIIADANPVPKSNGKLVNGPIFYNNTIALVDKMKKEIQSSSIKPDPDNPVIKALDDILGATNATFDKSGALVDHNPVPFSTAWKDKQIADAIGYGGTLTGVNFQDSNFKAIANAINQDIEASMPKWLVDGDKALGLFQEAKLIVQKRNTLFNPTNEAGKSIDTLLNSVSKPTETINNIIDDPEKLKRYLITGNIVIPDSSTKNLTGIKYVANNARKDAQGYQMMRMLNESTIPNPLDNTKQVFDGTKLQSIVNDPTKQESLKLLYGSEGLSNVKQLAKNIAMVSQKSEGMGASRYLGLKIGGFGISLGAGVATALTAGKISSGLTGGALGLGVTVGAHGLARLMTNPSTARIMINMSQGAPLGMSVNLATRMIANTLRGTAIDVNLADGNTITGKIDNTGKFTVPNER